VARSSEIVDAMVRGRAARIVLLLGLATYVLVRGVVPALSAIDADFPGYFTAAKIVADGVDAERLYDDTWFREQVRHYGLESAKNPAKFAPFPPPTALLLLPLTPLDPLTALRVVTVVSVFCLISSMLLLARALTWSLLDSALFILSGLGIIGCLRAGQPYILISTFCILGYLLYLRGRPWLAGICLGVFAPVKYYPAIILACLALQKQWKAVLGGAIAIFAVVLISVAALGWKIHQIFLLSVLGNHLTGHLSLDYVHTVAFTAAYQSFDTLYARLFIFDPVWNLHPLVAAPLLRTVGLAITKGSILFAAIATLVSLARKEAASALAPSVGITGILVLLIAPATAGYMCVLLWLPVALLIKHFLCQGARLPAYLILGIYVLMGLFPYGRTYVFEGRGGLTVLAYPRLFLLLAMFVTSVYFIARLGGRAGRDGPVAV
jgi:hypothetical protein